MYAIFDNLTLISIAWQNYQQAMPNCRFSEGVLKDGKSCLQTRLFCLNDFARNSGVYFTYCQKKNYVKNVKKHRKYFQIEEHGLIEKLNETYL